MLSLTQHLCKLKCQLVQDSRVKPENDIIAKSENDIIAKPENDIIAKFGNDIIAKFGMTAVLRPFANKA